MINKLDTAIQILDVLYLNQMFIDDRFIDLLEAKHNYLISSIEGMTKQMYKNKQKIEEIEDAYNLMKSELLTEVAEFDFDSVHSYIYNLLNLVEELADDNY